MQAREQRLRELRRMLEKNYAQWKRLGAQEALYHERLVEEANQSAEATLSSYQSGTSEFNTLMRARITELDVLLNDLRVRVDYAKAQARLLYLAPDNMSQPSPVEGTQP